MPNSKSQETVSSIGRIAGSRSRWVICIVLAVLVAVQARPAEAQASFESIDCLGASMTSAYGINNSREVVGEYLDGNGGQSGFVYSGGACSPIFVPGAAYTIAFDVNDTGQTVGIWGDGVDDRQHGFILSGGSYTTFDVGLQNTVPIGINNNGDVVGWFSNAYEGSSSGFLRAPGGGVTYITFAAGAEHNMPASINDAGVVVGTADSSLFRWTGGQVINISDQCPASALGNFNSGIGIDSTGIVVGTASEWPSKGLVCSVDSVTAFDVPVPGVAGTFAYGINDSGAVVGAYYDSGYSWHSYIYTPPRLKLFLDVDENFNETDPASDINQFVPGAELDTGVSVALPQEVQVIAAFIDAGGDIVPPPNGVTTVNFSLEQTSAFVGVAMNSGSGTSLDYELAASNAEFEGNTARVGLSCLDYGGFTIVRATLPGRPDKLQLAVPKDDDGNMFPDAGWRSAGESVSSSLLQRGDDADASPDNTYNGDGLSALEEYRGFFVMGEHIRLKPGIKDLFVYRRYAGSRFQREPRNHCLGCRFG